MRVKYFLFINNNRIYGEDLVTVKCIYQHPTLLPSGLDGGHPKVVVLLFLLHCFMYLPLCVGVMCLFFVFYALLIVLSSFAIILTWEEKLVAWL